MVNLPAKTIQIYDKICRKPLTLSEIAEATEIPLPTVSKILNDHYFYGGIGYFTSSKVFLAENTTGISILAKECKHISNGWIASDILGTGNLYCLHIAPREVRQIETFVARLLRRDMLGCNHKYWRKNLGNYVTGMMANKKSVLALESFVENELHLDLKMLRS